MVSVTPAIVEDECRQHRHVIRRRDGVVVEDWRHIAAAGEIDIIRHAAIGESTVYGELVVIARHTIISNTTSTTTANK